MASVKVEINPLFHLEFKHNEVVKIVFWAEFCRMEGVRVPPMVMTHANIVMLF